MTERDNLKVMYHHGITKDGYRYTIAGTVKDDDIHLGLSICAGEENFNKERGRTISTGRLLNQRKTSRGRTLNSLYAIDNEFKGEFGYPENYFIGKEIKIFRDLTSKFDEYTKNKLINKFHLKVKNNGK